MPCTRCLGATFGGCVSSILVLFGPCLGCSGPTWVAVKLPTPIAPHCVPRHRHYSLTTTTTTSLSHSLITAWSPGKLPGKLPGLSALHPAIPTGDLQSQTHQPKFRNSHNNIHPRFFVLPSHFHHFPKIYSIHFESFTQSTSSPNIDCVRSQHPSFFTFISRSSYAWHISDRHRHSPYRIILAFFSRHENISR